MDTLETNQEIANDNNEGTPRLARRRFPRLSRRIFGGLAVLLGAGALSLSAAQAHGFGQGGGGG